MTTREWLEVNAYECDSRDECIAACMKAVGCGKDQVVRKIRALGLRFGDDQAKKTTKAVSLSTISIDSLVQQHDTVGRVEQIAQDIENGQVMEDEKMRLTVGAGKDRWRVVRGNNRLAGNIYMLPTKAFVWGNSKTIALVAERMSEVL